MLPQETGRLVTAMVTPSYQESPIDWNCVFPGAIRRDMMMSRPRRCSTPIDAADVAPSCCSYCSIACVDELFAVSGWIVVMFVSRLDGNDGSTCGKTGAPGNAAPSCATLYVTPLRCSAFDTARNGMGS